MGSLSSNSTIANSSSITYNAQSGATYTIQAGDSNKVVQLTRAAGCAVTLPDVVTIGAGFHCWVQVLNVGANTLTASGVQKIVTQGGPVAGAGVLTLNPLQSQSAIGWNSNVHIGCDGVQWNTLEGDPLVASNLSGLIAATFSGLITPAPLVGLAGTTGANNVQAGSWGEYDEIEVVNGSAVSLTDGVANNVTSYALQPGDYDVWGQIAFKGGAGTLVQYTAGIISLVSNTFDAQRYRSAIAYSAAGQAIFGGTDNKIPVISRRVNVNALTTVYLVAISGFTVSTCAAYGALMWRRRR